MDSQDEGTDFYARSRVRIQPCNPCGRDKQTHICHPAPYRAEREGERQSDAAHGEDTPKTLRKAGDLFRRKQNV